MASDGTAKEASSVSTEEKASSSSSSFNPIQSIWAGLASVTDSQGDREANSSDRSQWLSDAGRLWENAVKDVGDRIRAVDSTALEGHVATLRDASGRFVNDVSNTMKNMNISLDQADLQQGAANLQTTTRDLLGRASEQLQKGTREAMELFVDAPNTDPTKERAPRCPPWDASVLPPAEQRYADEIRQQMLKIVVDAIYSKKRRNELFLSGVAQKAQFKFDFEANSSMALAALEADTNMRRLRAGLVPQRMREDDFWDTYFYHVDRIRKTLLANNGVMQEPQRNDDDDAGLFSDDDGEAEELAVPGERKPAATSSKKENAPKPPGAAGLNAGKTDGRNWDDEIDAIFEAKE